MADQFKWLMVACGDKANIKLPFLKTIKGERWLFATDGHRLTGALIEAFPDALQLTISGEDINTPDVSQLFKFVGHGWVLLIMPFRVYETKCELKPFLALELRHG